MCKENEQENRNQKATPGKTPTQVHRPPIGQPVEDTENISPKKSHKSQKIYKETKSKANYLKNTTSRTILSLLWQLWLLHVIWRLKIIMSLKVFSVQQLYWHESWSGFLKRQKIDSPTLFWLKTPGPTSLGLPTIESHTIHAVKKGGQQP